MSANLTSICRAMVKNAPNGLSAAQIADLVNMTYPTLMSELSGQPRHKMGADLLLPLMQASESAAPMHYLARELSGVYVPLPPGAAGECEVTKAMLNTVKEFGEFAAQVSSSLMDGSISAEELARINREGQHVLTATLAVMELAGKACDRR